MVVVLRWELHSSENLSVLLLLALIIITRSYYTTSFRHRIPYFSPRVLPFLVITKSREVYGALPWFLL